MNIKKISPIIATGAMILASISPIYADDQETSNVTSGNILPITKTIDYATGVTTLDKDLTFNYTVEATGDNASIAPTFKTTPSTFKQRNTTEGNKMENKDGQIVFTPTDATNPGVYTYKVTETKTTDDNIKYDESVYNVTVRVVNADSTNPGKLVVDQIVVEKDGKKTDLSFNNHYKEETTGKFVLKKIITGNDANAKDTFTFDVTFKAPENVDTKNVTGTKSDKDKTSYNFNLNGTTKVTLKGGEKITIPELPAGTTYTITETANNYTTSYVKVQNNAESKADGKTVNDGVIYDNGESKVTYTNSKDSSPLTGVIINNMPYIVLLGSSVLAISVLAAAKKHSAK